MNEQVKLFMDKLQYPFDFKDIEWKPQTAGLSKQGNPYAMLVAYVTARAIQQRLDEIVGPPSWKVEYQHLPNGIMCGLSIRTKDGEWVTKWDGAEATQLEPFKGGMSSALKRVASIWGIGRYLYGLPTFWAKFIPTEYDEKKQRIPNARRMKIKENDYIWLEPSENEMPDWALPIERAK